MISCERKDDPNEFWDRQFKLSGRDKLNTLLKNFRIHTAREVDGVPINDFPFFRISREVAVQIIEACFLELCEHKNVHVIEFPFTIGRTGEPRVVRTKSCKMVIPDDLLRDQPIDSIVALLVEELNELKPDDHYVYLYDPLILTLNDANNWIVSYRYTKERIED